MTEAIIDIFRTIQSETQCPFAKTADIVYACLIGTELSMPEAAQQLYEDIYSYVKEGIVAAPDGLAVSLPTSVVGNDFEYLRSGFNTLHRTLKVTDGLSEEELTAEDIEDPGR